MKKLYRASFSLGKENEPKPKLEEIIETAKSFIKRKSRGSLALDGFEEGIAINGEMEGIETIRVDEKGRKYFALDYHHAHGSQEEARWNITLAAVEDPEMDPKVDICVFKGNVGEGTLLWNSKATRPDLVPKLINKFGAHRTYPLSTEPLRLSSENMEEFVSRLKDSRRELPLVLISAGSKNQPIVNCMTIASELAGIALVYCAETASITSNKLSREIGSDLSCFNGAVRLYWPVGKRDIAEIRHKLWTPEQIRMHDCYGLERDLLSKISKVAVGAESKVDVDKIRRIKLVGEGDWRKLADEYARQNDGLHREIQEYLQTIEDRESVIAEREKAIARLEFELARERELRKTGASPETKQLFVPQTMAEAMDYFLTTAASKNLDVIARAQKMARDSVYEKSSVFLTGLNWLATIYHDVKTGAINGVDLRQSAQREAGMEYVPRQSPVTMGKYPEEYYIMYNGKRVALEEHLAEGDDFDPRYSLRVAFFFDPEGKRVVVGHIGKHQRNRKSN